MSEEQKKRRGGGGRGGEEGPPKRSRKGGGGAPAAPQTPLQETFAGYAATLDAENARREVVYKASRDITKASKDAISLLHRVPHPSGDAGRESPRAAALEAADAALRKVEGMIAAMAAKLTEPGDVHRFARQYSFSLEEYVEALSYLSFLGGGAGGDGALLTLGETNARLAAAGALVGAREGEAFEVSVRDFVLGVSDLAGELMRYATTAVSYGRYEAPATVCEFLRSLHGAYTALALDDKSMGKKIKVMRESLQKVETVCYRIRVRRAEFADEVMPVDQLFAADGGGGGGGDDE